MKHAMNEVFRRGMGILLAAVMFISSFPVQTVYAEEIVEPTEAVVVTEPAPTDPVPTEPVVTEPVVTEPEESEPVETEPEETEPNLVDPASITAASVSWQPERSEQSAGKPVKVTLAAALDAENGAGIQRANLLVTLTGDELAMLDRDSLASYGVTVQERDGFAVLSILLTLDAPSFNQKLTFCAPAALPAQTQIDVTAGDISVQYYNADGENLVSNTAVQTSGITMLPLPAPRYSEGLSVAVTWYDGENQLNTRPPVEDCGAELLFSLDGGESYALLTQENLGRLRMTALPEFTAVTEGERWAYSVAAGLLPEFLPTDVWNGEEGVSVLWKLQPKEIAGYQRITPEEAAMSGFVDTWVWALAYDATTADEKPIEIKAYSDQSWKIYWVDNNDAAADRYTPEEILKTGQLQLQFSIDGGESLPLTAENASELLGMPSVPEIEAEDFVDNDTVYTLSISDLPQTIEHKQDDTVTQKTVTWSLSLPEKEGYNLKEENGTYYYVETFDFVGNLVFHVGNDNTQEDLEAYTNALKLALSSRQEGSPTTTVVNDPTVVYNLEGENKTLTIPGLDRYTLDGIMISYALDVDRGDDNTQVTLPNGDWLDITFDNAQAPNAGDLDQRLYSGGDLIITLKGQRGFQAKKVWLDENNEQTVAARPDATFTLWRYREGEAITSAHMIQLENGEFVTLTMEADGTIKYPTDTLEKYDPDGYRYIYCVREELTYDKNDAQYEQVFGAPDSTGNDVKFDDIIAGTKITDTDGVRTGANANNDYLYDGGTLCNRITDTVPSTGEKVWVASSFSGQFGGVSVKLQLMSKHKGKDEEWTSTGVIAELTDFQSEHILSDSETKNMPKYDAMGHELEYQWVEVGVYQADAPDTNLMHTDTASGKKYTTLMQNGREVLYNSSVDTVLGDDGSYHTTVTNSLVETVSFELQKTWDKTITKAPITFDVYQVQADGSRIHYASLSMSHNGEATLTKDASITDVYPLTWVSCDEEDPYWAENSCDDSDPNWHGNIVGLPEFDENGAVYSYMLLEKASGSGQVYFPKYEQTFDAANGQYKATVHNAPPDGNQIIVEKIWLDDADTAHREDVTIGVYRKADETAGEKVDERIAEVTLNKACSWFKIISIGTNTTDEVYILEETVGTHEVTNTGTGLTATGKYSSDHHEYAVTYSADMRSQNGTQNEDGIQWDILAVTNRRVGVIDVQATKNWVDGENEDNWRSDLKAAADAVGYELVLKLEMLNTQELGEGYYVREVVVDGVTVGKVGIGNNTEVTVTGLDVIQPVDFDVSEKQYSFPGLPVYDAMGRHLRYQVREVWLDKEGNEATDLPLSIQEYWQDYSATRSDPVETVNKPGANGTGDDLLTMTFTNKRVQKMPISWNKLWKDYYQYIGGSRPGLYLDIYRVSYSGPDGGGVQETVIQNYKWSAKSGEEGTNYWTVTLEDMEKYDPQGYLYYYYAVERTSVDAYGHNYIDPQFAYPDGEGGALVTFGTSAEISNETFSDQHKAAWEIQTMARTFSKKYGLRNGGTFINTIHDTVAIKGEKIWGNLPAGFGKAHLPDIQITVSRSVAGGEMTEVATLTLDNWEQMTQPYNYEILYEGVNLWQKNDAGQWACSSAEDTPTLLPKYDSDGKLYDYAVTEIIVLDNEFKDDGAQMQGQENEGSNVYLYTPNITNYIIKNPYDPPKGKITVQKHLQLNVPLDGGKAPAVTFELTRSYQIVVDSKKVEVEDKKFTQTVTWNSDDVLTAYNDTPDKENGSTVTVTNGSLVFENLEIYAPNGSKYIYTVTESKENLDGYDTYADAGNKAFSELTTEQNAVGGLSAADDDDVDATFQNVQPEKETIRITGEKVWNDKSDALSIRPDSLTLILYRYAPTQPGQENAVDWHEYKRATVNAANEWAHTFENLPVYADNGMPWQYRVVEYVTPPEAVNAGQHDKADVPDGYDVSGSGTVGNNYKITNTPSATTARFSKTWVNTDGDTFTNDYLGLDLSVEFKLQVREKNGANATWVDAFDFFRDNEAQLYFVDSSDKYTNAIFERTLSGTLTTGTWSGCFDGLPVYVGVGKDDTPTELEYQVVETSIKVGDKFTQNVPAATGETTIFNPIKPDNQARNELPTIKLTVEKKWEGDHENAYNTRPMSGGKWSIDFAIQRRQKVDNDTETNASTNAWATVTTGTLDAGTPSVTVEDLPTFGIDANGKVISWEYRAVELNTDEDKTPVEHEGTFNTTYKVTYSEHYVTKDSTIVITNSLINKQKFQALKTWYADVEPADGVEVTLSLRFKAANNTIYSYDVVLDGIPDTNPSKPYYEDSEWHAVWKDVPVYHPLAPLTSPTSSTLEKTSYEVVETVPAGFVCIGTTTQNAVPDTDVTFKNKEIVKVTVEKGWDDQEEIAVYVALFRKLKGVDDDPWTQLGKQVQLKNGTYTHNFGDQDRYNSVGQEYEYQVREMVNDKPVVYTNSSLDPLSYTVHYTDGFQSTTRPFTYHTKITNRGKISITVDKKWYDDFSNAALSADDREGIRPTSITLKLERKVAKDTTYEPVIDARTTWNQPANGHWSVTYSYLPKTNEAGEPYIYRVTEEGEIPGYEKTVYTTNAPNADEEYELVNTQLTDITVEKIWKDKATEEYRPTEIVFTLLKGEDSIETKTASEATGWTCTFDDLPKYDRAGNRIEYSVVESAVPGYAQTSNIFQEPNKIEVTNTLTGTVDLRGTKTWLDNGDKYETRPTTDKFQLNLSRKTDETDWETVVDKKPVWTTDPDTDTDTDNNVWTYAYTGLPKYDAEGRLYTYKVEEVVPVAAGYIQDASKSSEKNFTNVLSGELFVRVVKVWQDGSDAQEMRPANLKVTLKRRLDGEKEFKFYQEVTIAGDMEQDQWTYTISGLDMYNDEGVLYEYTVEETLPDGYKCAIAKTYPVKVNGGFEFGLTNILTTSVEGTKTWKDFNNTYGFRPQSIDVILMADGKEVDRETISEDEAWSYSFENLDCYAEDGHKIVYTVEEYIDSLTIPEGMTELSKTLEYRSNVEGYDITNTLYDVVDITITKIWRDDNNAGGQRPESITVGLFNGDEKVTEDTIVTGSSTADTWTYTFTSQPKYDLEGKEIVYTVKELSEDGNYQVTNIDLTITNTILIDIPVNKVWLDNSNAYQTRPEKITLILLADGVELREAEISGTGNTWSHTFVDLPKYDSKGKEIRYTASEILPEKYVLSVSTDGRTLTNTLTDFRNIPVRKYWTDNEDAFENRPAQITVRLFANGVEVQKAVLDEVNTEWRYVFEDVPTYDAQGVKIEYTVLEDAVEGYTVYYDGFDIKNVGHGAISITKKVTGSLGSKTHKFRFIVMLDDETINGTYGDMTFENGVAVVKLKHGETATAVGIPAGVSYKVTEKEANRYGYITQSRGTIGEVKPGEISGVWFLNGRYAETLPQTGQLNWPIPIMGGSGLILLLAGLLLRKRKKYHR